MNEYPKWPHLENLDRVLKDIPDYLSREDTTYVVTEKVHGFNARFGVSPDGVPWAGSRNQTVAEGDPDGWSRGDLQGFVGYAADKVRTLTPGATIFGEWAGKGVQKGIDYGPKDFYVFGWASSHGLGPFEGTYAWAERNGARVVPLLSVNVTDLDHLNAERQAKSLIAEQGREGIVIYPWPPILDAYGHVVIAKYKAPAFEERTRFRNPNTGQSKFTLTPGAEAFCVEYVTEMRMEHVLALVAEESGSDPLDPANTGLVLKTMYADCVREGKDDFEALTEDEQKFLGKVMNPHTKRLLDAARQRSMEEAA